MRGVTKSIFVVNLLFLFAEILASQEKSANIVVSGKERLDRPVGSGLDQVQDNKGNKKTQLKRQRKNDEEDEMEVEVELDTKEENNIFKEMEDQKVSEDKNDIAAKNENANIPFQTDLGDNDKSAMEVEVEVDTKEEMKIMEAIDNETPELETQVAAKPNEPTIQTENSNDKKTEGTQELKKEKQPKENTEEVISKFMEQPNPLWKIKDFVDETREAGFELTAEEMKKFKIWKDGVIPYYIDVVSFSDKVLRDKIRNYLQMVNSGTGVNFVELPTPPSNDNERWVFFMNRRGLLGCADHTVKNFTNQGVQQVVLGYDCMETRGELAEAVMSILGVPAQHNAPDRDNYITVNMENIMPDKKHLFEKLSDGDWLFHDLGYDYNSITHYDIFKYSANGRPTIQFKNDSKDFNPAKTLSPDDYLKIKMLYNYITRNAQMHAPACEKLFKPRNEFERFVPNKAVRQPRSKPSRYLGGRNARMSLTQDNDDAKTDRYLKQLIQNAEKKKNAKNRRSQMKRVTQTPSDEITVRHVRKTDALTLLSDYQSN